MNHHSETLAIKPNMVIAPSFIILQWQILNGNLSLFTAAVTGYHDALHALDKGFY